MSFFRNLFESKPAQTDQEYTVSLIDQLLDGKVSPYLISNLKEFSHEYPDEISSRGIPELVKALAKFPENDDVAKDLITIFADLLRTDNLKKEENAKTFLECEDTIPNFVRNLDNKTPQIRVGSMHVLMMIANLQPSLFTESLTSHQPQMIRLFGSISDQNEQISSKFVTVIPKLVENNPDFQQIVGFYAFEALVNSINRERPEFLEAMISVLKDNQINQSLFVNSGYLSTIDKMLRTPDEKILDLMLIIFDPYKNSNNLESFRKNLEPTNIINTLCDNIIKNVYRPLNVHLLSVCIKGNSELTNNTREKIPDFVRLTLEIRKSATVNNGNNSFLDGLDLFGEFFENFVFESDDNSHFLNLTIINSQNLGFDGLSESFLNLVTFSCLIAPNCKSDFEEIFNSLISNLRRYETVSSMFKFFVCFCWQSKEHCDMISTEDKLTILIQLLINDKSNNNAIFVPNFDPISNAKRNHFLFLLFAEIILFSGKNRAKIGSIVNTSVLPIELEESINQFENSEFKDNSKFGQLEKQIIQYINENHLQDALNQDDNDNNDNDFYKSEYSRLKTENKELNEKLTRNEDDLNSIKIENDEKSNQIKSLLSQIDDLTNNNVNIISKDVQLNDGIENNDSQQSLENKLKELQNENQSIKELNNQLTQENQSIKEQNKMIQEQNSNLQEEIEKIKQNQNLTNNDLVNKLNSEIENLTKQLEEKDTTHKEIADNLMNQINELKSQIEDKNVRLQNEESSQLQLRGEIDDLSSKLAESNNSYESLQEQNRISSNELDQLRSSLENAKNISEDFQKQISEKNNSISSLKSQNEQLKNKIEKKSIETTEIIEKFSKEISELRSQQNLAGGELISSLNNQIEELKNENNQQKHEFENEKEILNQSISELQSENNRLEDDCNSLLNVKAKLQEEENKHENNEKLLTSKNDELQKQIKEIESLNAQKIEAITLSFNTEKEKLLIEKESLKAQIKKLKENEQSNKDENDSLRKQISEMKEVTLPINEVESIRKQNVEMTKKCSELNSKVNELQNKLNQNQNDKDSKTKLDEENNIDELLRIKVTELENQIEQYKIECIEKDDSISSLTAQVKEAKKVQKANDKVAADLRKTNSDLQDQVNHMLKQIEELQLLTQYKNLLNLNSPKSNNQQKQSKSGSNVANRDLQFEVEISKNSKSKKSSNSNSNEIESNNYVIKNFKQQNEQLSNQVNNLQNENQNLQNQLNESKSKETEKSNQVKQLQKVIEKLQKENATLQEEMQTQKSNKDKKSENNNRSITKDKNINDSNDELAKSLKEQSKEIINTMTKIKNENKLIQEQDLDNSLLKDINYSFEEEEEEINNDETNTQNETQKVQSNSKPSNNTDNEIASDSSFSTTKSSLESIVAKQRKLINDLRAQNQKLEANGIEATTNAESLASENEKLKADFKRSQQEAASIVQKLKKKLSTVANENSKLQSQINEIQTANQQRKEQSKGTENNSSNSINSPSLNKKIQELQSQVSLLKAENEKLKNTPTKALVNALQEEKANLEEKVYKLNDELSKLKKDINKEKENDSNDDLLSSFRISPIQQKTAKKPSKSSKSKPSTKSKHTSSNRDFDDAEILDKLLTENEILKRDNENQSHTITDLQMMLEMQNIESDNQFSIPNNSGFNGYSKYHLPYASFDEELKNLSVENEVLNSKLNEMKAIEAENKKLQNENTELKRLIRNRTPSFVSETEISKRDSPNLSELKQKKALRVIGKLYLDKQQQKLNM